jgi:NAD(P)-dependent dehydrogenase (short-subunit alcohol dehydrogenase family)
MTKKLDGKVAVITGSISGMALATAKLFVEERAYVFFHHWDLVVRRRKYRRKAIITKERSSSFGSDT